MLVLANTGDAYVDDADSVRRYRLPTGLAPLPGPDGTPQIALSRSPDGGLLSLRLGAVWPTLMANDRRVPFASGRFRLVLQTPAARETGQWWPTPVVGDAVVERSVSLSPIEAAIAAHLGQQTDDLVDVDIELSIRGLAPAFPWLVSASAETLRPRLAALLPQQPAAWEDVEAAFLGLTEDTFTWYPLRPDAMRPPLDEALTAVAHHAAPVLMTSSANGWTLNATGPARLDLSLDVPLVQSSTIGFRWSFSEFLATQPDPHRHLVDLAGDGPFAASVVSVMNDLPLAVDGIRSLSVDVRTGGPSGMLHHDFLPGEPGAVRLTFVSETFDASSVEWRVRYTVMTSNGPIVDGTDFRPAGQAIELNASTVGLSALRFTAEADVFDHVASLEIVIGTRTIVLSRTTPDAWAVGRQPPTTASVTAIVGSNERHPLGALSITPLGLTVDVAMLGVGDMAAVALCPPADLSQRAAYLAVQVEGHPWRTLDPDGQITVTARRQAKWQPPPVKYRTRHVVLANGTTGLMVDSPWHDAVGDAITVEV
jgi:hypothetical protein